MTEMRPGTAGRVAGRRRVTRMRAERGQEEMRQMARREADRPSERGARRDRARRGPRAPMPRDLVRSAQSDRRRSGRLANRPVTAWQPEDDAAIRRGERPPDRSRLDAHRGQQGRAPRRSVPAATCARTRAAATATGPTGDAFPERNGRRSRRQDGAPRARDG